MLCFASWNTIAGTLTKLLTGLGIAEGETKEVVIDDETRLKRLQAALKKRQQE